MLDLSSKETAPQIKSLREENDNLDLKDLKIMKNFLCKKNFPIFKIILNF